MSGIPVVVRDPSPRASIWVWTAGRGWVWECTQTFIACRSVPQSVTDALLRDAFGARPYNDGQWVAIETRDRQWLVQRVDFARR